MKKRKIISMIIVAMLIFTCFSGMGIKKVEAAETTDGLWRYSIINEIEVKIDRYLGWAKTVNIPNTINGMKVTSIGDRAFLSCTSLTSVTIPTSIKSIGDGAFEKCSGLTSITIPTSVTRIGNGAFSDCDGLTKTTIPSSVTSIGTNPFEYCDGLTTIVVDANNKNYDSRNNYNAIIEKSSNKLISGCKNTIIPTSVTSIGACAFRGCIGLIYLKIPEGVISIEHSVFYDCRNLKEMTIPEGVTSIGLNAFYNCTSIKNLTIPSSVISIGECAFYGCSSLESIKISEGISSIEDKVFSGCKNLMSIIIPKSVKRIEAEAFSGCSGLASITIPDSVYSIGDSAFEGCRLLTSITIPTSVSSIGEKAFAQSGLTSITIPIKVTSIGEGAFSYCSSLISIAVDKDNGWYDSRDNCNAIIEKRSNKLISGCKNTVIPESVTFIGNSAFEGCSGLTSLTIPQSVTYIGYNVFKKCNNFTTVYTNKGSYAEEWFINYNKNNIHPVQIIYTDVQPTEQPTEQPTIQPTKEQGGYYKVIPNVGTISDDGLTLEDENHVKYTIAERLDKKQLKSYMLIADSKSNGKYMITDLEVSGGNAIGGSVEFTGAYDRNSSSVIVPDKVTIAGVTFDVTSIGNNAFNKHKKLTKVTIGKNVTKIGEKTFFGESGLKKIIIKSKKLKTVGSKAFYKINKKAVVKVPKGKKKKYSKLLKKKGKLPKTAKIK